MTDFIRVPEMPGKWYVSRGMRAGRTDGRGIEIINPHRTDRLLAGPFETEQEAKDAIAANGHWYEPYLWRSTEP